MAYRISSFAGAGAQFFDNNGDPLSGGLLYTYASGTTTPATTWTSISGAVANTNPIVLDAAGRTPNEMWLITGSTYKFVLKTSTGITIGTYDNIPAVDDPTLFNNLITVTGTNTLIGTSVPAYTAYVAGMTLSFLPVATNTGAVTIDLDGLGAKNVYSDSSAALTAGQLIVGKMAVLEYDGTRFQLLSSSGIADGSITTAKLADGAVTSVKLANDAVTTSKIAANAITPAKLSAGGPSWDSSGNLIVTGTIQNPSGIPSVGAAAWVNFNGVSDSNPSGTYSQTGTTVTVTITNHGQLVGQTVYLNALTGTLADGNYTVASVTSANVFTVTSGTSATISGTLELIRSIIRGSSNVSSVTDNGTGDYSINFTTALADANYAWAMNGQPDQSAGAGVSTDTMHAYRSATGVTSTGLRMIVGSGFTLVNWLQLTFVAFR